MKEIIDQLPYAPPFLFVDELHYADQDRVKGAYTFTENEYFYKGHFKDNPVTPGVILTECCAQIGLVCMGLHILSKSNTLTIKNEIGIAFSSSEMEFYLPVYPNTKVVVSSEKIYFRFHKLKCAVKMYNTEGALICKGILSGMLKPNDNE